MKKTLKPIPVPQSEAEHIEIFNRFAERWIKRESIPVAIEIYVARHTIGADQQWVTTTVLELSKALERPKSKVRQGLKKALQQGTVIRQKSEEGYKLALADPNSLRSFLRLR